MNDNVKKMVSNIPEEVKERVRDYANNLVNSIYKTSGEDMQKFYDYMDKMGIEYTVDKNPSQEKIDKIKEQIKKNEEIRRIK